MSHKQPGLDGRHRDAGGQISEKRGNTRVDTLRETYGDGFAKGARGDMHLSTLLDRTGTRSLSDYLKKPVAGSVLGTTKDGVRILKPKGRATNFTAKELRSAVRSVQAAKKT